jgi:acyl-CoA reductase-like NAD-dependent aldehyde dehydrogenase
LAIWGIIPNIIVGNTVVFKPSELTPLSSESFFKIFEKAGFPKGVVNLIQGDGKVGQMLLDEKVDFVWFTGSSATGKQIYEKCGQKFIKCLLELGGSSPAIVFEDVDIKKVAQEIFAARFSNCGQICSSVKRLFIHKKIYRDFIKELTEIINNTKVGDPFAKDTIIGPLVSQKQREVLEVQVLDAIKKGAKIETGARF